jgi:hypothetical protein
MFEFPLSKIRSTAMTLWEPYASDRRGRPAQFTATAGNATS